MLSSVYVNNGENYYSNYAHMYHVKRVSLICGGVYDWFIAINAVCFSPIALFNLHNKYFAMNI